MKAIKSTSVSALSAGLLVLSMACSAYASTTGEAGGMRDNPTTYTGETGHGVRHHSYGSKVGNKLLRGLANMTLALVEVPKNMIIATNAEGVGGEGSNWIWGLAGGSIKGANDMIMRTGAGLVDVLTFPLPTQSVPRPEYPWQKFDEDTSYGNIFQYDDE